MNDLSNLFIYFAKYPTSLLKFFTCIGFAILLLGIVCKPVRDNIDLLLLYCIIGPIGFVLTYICPKYIKINITDQEEESTNKRTVTIQGKIWALVDLLFHFIPFILLVIAVKRGWYVIPKDKHNIAAINAFLIFLVYFIIVDVSNVYSAQHCDNYVLWASLAGLISYIFITST